MKTTPKYGKKTALALSLWVKLARSYTSLWRVSDRSISEFGLTTSQFGAIECLGHLGPMPMGTLGKKMLVTGGNMTCVVDNLERDGLVKRMPGKSDRRSIDVHLTSKGKKLFDDIFSKHAKRITKSVSVLTESEQAQLAALLKKLGLGLQRLDSGSGG